MAAEYRPKKQYNKGPKHHHKLPKKNQTDYGVHPRKQKRIEKDRVRDKQAEQAFLEDVNDVEVFENRPDLTTEIYWRNVIKYEQFRRFIRSAMYHKHVSKNVYFDFKVMYNEFNIALLNPGTQLIPITLARVLTKGLPLAIDPHSLTVDKLHEEIEKEYGFNFFRTMRLEDVLPFVRGDKFIRKECERTALKIQIT